MNIVLDKTYRLLFLLGVFFIPFNSFDGISLLGEFKSEAAAFFFISGFLLLLFGLLLNYKATIPLKSPYMQLVLIFILWCLIATLLNGNTVYQNYFKQTSGTNRFIRQYFSLLISALFFLLFYWNVIRKMSAEDILFTIRKVFLFSLIIASVYGFFEILVVYFNMLAVLPIIRLFDYFPFFSPKIFGSRISSISYEAPALAIYLITIAGWMFSYIITSKGIKKFVPILLVLILAFFSGSRTALIVISLQLITFLFILLLNRRYRKYVFIFFGTAIFIVITALVINSKEVAAEVEKKIESLDFKSNLTESVSNKSRLGIQYASLQVFKEHPVVGVGYGQQAYHNRFHYPVWATKNNYEFSLIYKNPTVLSFPPGYNIYLRLMTETGVIGLSVFVLLLIMIFRQTIWLIKNTTENTRVLSIVLLVSFIGFSINFLQIDTFRLYGFWICLAILIQLSYLNKSKVEIDTG